MQKTLMENKDILELHIRISNKTIDFDATDSNGLYSNMSNMQSVNETTRISNDEKEELVSMSLPQGEGLGKFNLLIAFLLLGLILSIFLPKIYISNNIYYVSRNISKLQAEKELLLEEKQNLNRNIELIKNKHLLMELDY